ncbi:hypothetical protein DL96DRAFT_1573297 [Flagelloscypha sp. PMI_526]|nr:hypothetical protein DL96DRAFT_1573297 [Flagelloscypha sp. PMI_526]
MSLNSWAITTLSPARMLVHLQPLVLLITVLSLLQSLPCAIAEFTAVNGQLFSHGLAIIDAPAPNSPFHAKANIPIAIEVSGNGKIPVSAAVPGSGIPTRFDLLEVSSLSLKPPDISPLIPSEIYLTSLETNTNLTISSGPSLLQNEATSSVKHIDYLVPDCIQPGNYNVTFYESSHVNESAHFIITHIPITLDNTSGANATCTANANTLVSEPQAQNNLVGSPFLPSNLVPVITSSTKFITTTMPATSTYMTTKPGETTGVQTTWTGEVTTVLPAGFLPANGSQSGLISSLSLCLVLFVLSTFISLFELA